MTLTYTNLNSKTLGAHCYFTIIHTNVLCGCFPSSSSLIFQAGSTATICQKEAFYAVVVSGLYEYFIDL